VRVPGEVSSDWVRAIRQRLSRNVARLEAGSRGPEALTKARWRRLVLEVLQHAQSRDDAGSIAVLGVWARTAPVVDAWIDAVGSHVASLVVAEAEAAHVIEGVQGFTVLATAIDPWQPGPAERLLARVDEALTLAMAPREIHRTVGQAIERLIALDGGLLARTQIVNAVRDAALAAQMDVGDAPHPLRGIMARLDERLWSQIARLQDQVAWMGTVEDPVLHPGFQVVLERLASAAALRRSLAACVSQRCWQSLGPETRTDVSARAARVDRGLDSASDRRWFADLAAWHAGPDVQKAVIDDAAWPSTDVERLRWRPAAHGPTAGRVVWLLEARRAAAIRRDRPAVRRIDQALRSPMDSGRGADRSDGP